MICQKCGAENGNNEYCHNCGSPLNAAQQSYQQQPGGQYPPPQPNGQYPPYQQQASQGSATAPFVLGIISIIAGLLSPIVGIILAVIGLILGIKAKNAGVQNKTTASIVLSSCGIGISVISWIIATMVILS